jgi:hypothetical protein
VITKTEQFRGSLYEAPDRILFVVRVIDPRPDLATSLRAARRPGTPTKIRRGWAIEGYRLRLSFEVLEPEPCRRRAFYVPAGGLDAFIGGCAVGLDTRPSRRRRPAGAHVLPLRPTEGPRFEVLEALTEALHKPLVAIDASPWLTIFNVCDGIERPTTPDVAMGKPTSHLVQTWHKPPKRPPVAQGPR